MFKTLKLLRNAISCNEGDSLFFLGVRALLAIGIVVEEMSVTDKYSQYKIIF